MGKLRVIAVGAATLVLIIVAPAAAQAEHLGNPPIGVVTVNHHHPHHHVHHCHRIGR